MSTKKSGVLAVSTEWAKHLRKWGKKAFWSSHRNKEKKFIQKSLDN